MRTAMRHAQLAEACLSSNLLICVYASNWLLVQILPSRHTAHCKRWKPGISFMISTAPVVESCADHDMQHSREHYFEGVRTCCMDSERLQMLLTQVLEACCSCSAQSSVQAAALQAVRGALQRSQAGAIPSAAAAWAWDCAARALPAATADVHGLMRGGNAAALSPGEVQVTCL
jgi:hypothetical protein